MVQRALALWSIDQAYVDDYPRLLTCRRDYTHFVSIPLPGAAPVYAALRDSVMLDAATAAAAGLHPSVWVSPASLHLTVVMLKLDSGEARHVACEVRTTQSIASGPLLSVLSQTLSQGLAT